MKKEWENTGVRKYGGVEVWKNGGVGEWENGGIEVQKPRLHVPATLRPDKELQTANCKPKTKWHILLFILGWSSLCVALIAQTSPERIEKRLTSSITLFQEISANPALAVQGLRIKPGQHVRLEASLGGDQIFMDNTTRGREPTSRSSWRHRAVAAINADYFPFTGDPLGLCIVRGELVSEPFPNRPAIGWTADRRVVIGAPLFDADVTRADGQKRTLAGLNRSAKADELVLSTNYFGSIATAETAGVAVVLDGLERPMRIGRTVKAFVREVKEPVNSAPIPFTGGVLFGCGAAADFLRGMKPGDVIQIRLDLRVEEIEKAKNQKPKTKNEWHNVLEAVAGGPWLIRDGKPAVKEDFEVAGFNEGFWNRRHPRTAVGLTRKGELLWVTVDGRQAHSQGITLPDLANLMVRLGAVQAINLDGGGSTTLVVQDLIVNSPSDGTERPVANALLLYDDTLRPATNQQPYTLNPPTAALKVGEQVRFRVSLDDKPVSTWLAVWGCNGVGFIDQWGRLTALRPGTGTVSAWVNGAWLHALVNVTNGTPTPAEPTTPPNNKQAGGQSGK